MKIELKQLQAAFGTTFVYVTHDQSEALVLLITWELMSQGRFEQLGTPQDLYYRPDTPFVASFVGANNRIVGRVTGLDQRRSEMTTADRLGRSCAEEGAMAVGDAVEGFVRPEVASLGARSRTCPPRSPGMPARCRACCSTAPIPPCSCRSSAWSPAFIALRETGQFSDLKPQEKVFFSFDPRSAPCASPRARGRRGRMGERCHAPPVAGAARAWSAAGAGASLARHADHIAPHRSRAAARFESGWGRASTSQVLRSTATSSRSPCTRHVFVRTRAVMSVAATLLTCCWRSRLHGHCEARAGEIGLGALHFVFDSIR